MPPKCDLRTQRFQIRGVDLTRIDGIDVTTAQREPRGPGAVPGGSDLAFEPIGAGGLLPAHVCPHGQTQRRQRTRCVYQA